MVSVDEAADEFVLEDVDGARHNNHYKEIEKINRVVFQNFGHPALISSFTKYTFLQVKNSFAPIVNGMSVLNLFQLSNGDLLFL